MTPLAASELEEDEVAASRRDISLAVHVQRRIGLRHAFAAIEPVFVTPVYGGVVMIRTALVAAAALVGLAAPALAEGRYQLQTVEGGIVRLDTQTGAMDFCKVAAGALDCSPAAPAPRAQAARPADTVDLDPKAVEKQMEQAMRVMDTMLPTMMRAMMRMQNSMEREMDRMER